MLANFKIQNFAKLDEFKSFAVTPPTACKLGKWIAQEESAEKCYTKSSQWAELKVQHEKVHSEVQKYIDMNAQRVSHEELTKVAKNIEDETLKIFEELNQLAQINCECS